MRITALYYMSRLRAPIDMCDQMATSLCRLAAVQNASSAYPVSMVKGHLHLHGIDIDGISDFVAIMKRFDMEQWPVTPKTANLTNLLAAVTTQLGYYPLVTISLSKGYVSHRPVVSLDKPMLLLRKVGSQTDMAMAATLLFTLTKYLKEFCDRYSVCLQRGQAEHIVTTIIKFEQLLSFIHWPTLLTAVLGRHHNITPESDVVIKSPHYLKGLDEVLEKSSEPMVTLYIGYTIFSWFAPLIVNLDASTNVLMSPSSEHNRLWSKFQCLLLSEGVFGFAYLHAFASQPGFDVLQKAVINATKQIIRALQEFTIITPWFKKEDADMIYRKQCVSRAQRLSAIGQAGSSELELGTMLSPGGDVAVSRDCATADEVLDATECSDSASAPTSATHFQERQEVCGRTCAATVVNLEEQLSEHQANWKAI
ncbi:hypothetical protein HPB50_010531 [Hyalomma asiaticum]|uniref:Uncharacterized protein n=1 Tax=Hyalomma asiaticum TaxID=266040 RepID=A0ACB7TID0_HYAAI|nr:hypothetical protein HPB50_010531 [Hyalomma asiaticum]